MTLYTSKDCAPCEEGRRLLSQRGVPTFIEAHGGTGKRWYTAAKLGGQKLLPVATIGSKRLIGYTQSDWDQYLTAGYSAESKLPPNYRRPQPRA